MSQSVKKKEHKERQWMRGALLSFCAFLLVSSATREKISFDALFLISILAISLGIFYRAFPGSRFFYLALTNYITAYVCVFEIFHEVLYKDLSLGISLIGFALPLAAFIGGALARRKSVRLLIADAALEQRIHDKGVFFWLIPVGLVGLSSVLLIQTLQPGVVELQWIFLVAMSAIALLVLHASVQICSFFIETGLLFEEFFQFISRASVPVFAFVTFYSMQVIVFGCLYRLADNLSEKPLFLVRGVSQDISFPDALYFSLITVSTVGYGDIVANSDLLRALVSLQVVMGVLLIIFGVAEIQRFYLDLRERHKEE